MVLKKKKKEKGGGKKKKKSVAHKEPKMSLCDSMGLGALGSQRPGFLGVKHLRALPAHGMSGSRQEKPRLFPGGTQTFLLIAGEDWSASGGVQGRACGTARGGCGWQEPQKSFMYREIWDVNRERWGTTVIRTSRESQDGLG